MSCNKSRHLQHLSICVQPWFTMNKGESVMLWISHQGLNNVDTKDPHYDSLQRTKANAKARWQSAHRPYQPTCSRYWCYKLVPLFIGDNILNAFKPDDCMSISNLWRDRIIQCILHRIRKEHGSTIYCVIMTITGVIHSRYVAALSSFHVTDMVHFRLFKQSCHPVCVVIKVHQQHFKKKTTSYHLPTLCLPAPIIPIKVPSLWHHCTIWWHYPLPEHQYNHLQSDGSNLEAVSIS